MKPREQLQAALVACALPQGRYDGERLAGIVKALIEKLAECDVIGGDGVHDPFFCRTHEQQFYGSENNCPKPPAKPAPPDTNSWRQLALQFDGHRMQALGHLRSMLANACGHAPIVEQFLAAPPLPSEAVLAQRLGADKAEAFHEWMDKTAWMQDQIDTFHGRTLGLHRADILRNEINYLRGQLEFQRGALNALAVCDGSPENVADAPTLAARVRAAAYRALKGLT
jgi:hypothetical protein